MKKKILGTVLIAVTAITISWNFDQKKNEITLSNLATENIEALAQGEGGVPQSWCCGHDGTCWIDWANNAIELGDFRVTPC